MNDLLTAQAEVTHQYYKADLVGTETRKERSVEEGEKDGRRNGVFEVTMPDQLQ